MSNNSSKDTIEQTHFGAGDNVGEKHVYNSISPSAIQASVVKILTSLRHRDPFSADSQLQSLKTTSQLNTESKSVIELLSVLIQLAKKQKTPDAYAIAEECINTKPGAYFEDIAISTILRLNIESGKPDDAITLYKSLDSPGIVSQEVYYEFLASESELIQLLDNHSHRLTENTLCGLSRGLIRCESQYMALKSAQKLLERYPSFNSRVIEFIARCHYLSNQELSIHYWLISTHVKNQVLCLADDCINLLSECEGKDPRIVELAESILNYSFGSHEFLADTCWKFITNIEAIDMEFGSMLRSYRDKNFSGLDNLDSKIDKASKDPSYKQSIIDHINAAKELSSSEDLVLFCSIADSKTVREWIENGGKVSSEDEIEREFNQLELLCHASDGSPKYTRDLIKSADTLLSKVNQEPNNLNLVRVNGLAIMLINSRIAHKACALLEPIISGTELWLSPIVKTYINCLLECQRLTTLETILTAIPSDDWCDFEWQAKARQHDFLNELSEAVYAMEQALEKSPNSLQIWDYLIYLLGRNTNDPSLYEKYLNRIPTEILSEPNEKSLRLLLNLSENSQYEIVDTTIVNWFINNPIQYAKHITDFSLNRIYRKNNSSASSFLASTDNCIGGYRYTLDGKDITKLIIRDAIGEPKHPAIIKESSPLAQKLISMSINDTIQYDVYELTLFEKLPPFVAVLRLSADIRQTINDGSDCFYQLSMPDNPDEMILHLEKKIAALHKSDIRDKFYLDPAFPIYMKGHLLGKSCPILSALEHFTSQKSIKHSLPNIGVSIPEILILDVYSIVYLAITGLFYGLERTQTKTVITVETEAYLKDFLNTITNDYMQIGVTDEGKLWRITAEQFNKETADIQAVIKNGWRQALC